jgi:hypothetical protein
MSNRTLLVIAAVLAAAASPHGHACSVAPSEVILWDTDSSRESADVVALVTVASWTKTEQWGAKVELSVERVWKGELSSRWTITQELGSSCDSALRRNVRYVIFATRLDDGKFRVAGVSDGALSIVADRLDGKIQPPRLNIGR